jgi:Flp pilus assembly pilin Flp
MKFISEERGGEVLEYALIAGIIVIAAIAVIAALGRKTVLRWTSINCNL